MANPEERLYIVGTTATGGEETTLRLSEERAVSVQAILVDLGVSPVQLTVIGVGCKSAFHTPDTTSESGELIEEKAAQNRAVLLIPKDHPDVSRIQEFLP